MSYAALFLDRDGTINEDPGYLGEPSRVKLFPETGKALSKLKRELDFKFIVISNQSGIARGYITTEMVDSVNKKINEILLEDKVSIDAFYYCPHHPDFGGKEDCLCRKPSPQLVNEAAEKLDIDLKKSFFVGDSLSDMECGENAGLKTILVKTGYGKDTFSLLKKENKIPTFVAENLADACEIIYKDFTGEN